MNIISAENYKMRKDRSLKVLFIICVVFFVFFGFAMKTMLDISSPGPTDGGVFGSGIAGMTSPFLFSQFYNLITICCAVFAGASIVGEFEKGTIRNALTTGTGKASYYLSKLYSQLLSCKCLMLVSIIIFMASMTFFVGWGSFGGSNYPLTLFVFLLALLFQLFAYSSIFTMLAFLLRSTGGVIGLGIGYIMFESLIAQLLLLPNIALLDEISAKMPYSIIMGLASYVENDAVLTGDFLFTLVPAVIIIVITTAIGMFTFVKRDVK